MSPRMYGQALSTLLSLGLILGCQSHGVVSDQTLVSICDVRDDAKSFVGKSVRIRADYVTDNAFYSFFVDESCRAKRNSLSMENRKLYETGDPSVIQLVRAGSSKCAGQASVCPVSARVDIEGTVVEDGDGGIGLNATRVYSYEWN